MPRLDDLKLFTMVAVCGSFSEAARPLNISPTLASAAIKRLEKDLGVRLFERSTRQLRLTSAGERYLPHARQALSVLDEGHAAAQGAVSPHGLTGRLRISVPSDLGRRHLLAWLDAFVESQGNAGLALDIRISDRLSNLVQNPVDFAIRYGELDASNLIALPLSPGNRRVLCASPAYLARHGVPVTPQALKHHECLRFVLGSSIHTQWQFETPEGLTVVQVSGSRMADDAHLVHEWALRGLGIAYKSELEVAVDLAQGTLVRLLPDAMGERAPLSLVVVGRHCLNDGIRQLAAFLQARCAELVRVAA
jgi:DNA-binding transcriptional LysR family regulator